MTMVKYLGKKISPWQLRAQIRNLWAGGGEGKRRKCFGVQKPFEPTQQLCISGSYLKLRAASPSSEQAVAVAVISLFRAFPQKKSLAAGKLGTEQNSSVGRALP